MNARTVRRCFSSSLAWLMLMLTCSSALYLFVYFTQLLLVSQPPNVLLASTQQVNRSHQCCPESVKLNQQLVDVCGRSNCTWNCPDHIQLPINQKVENAFFLETSGSGSLNIRQACAVESLALHNPKLTVNVFFMMDYGQKRIKKESKVAETVEHLKKKYFNIQFTSVNLDEYIAGTLLEKWYHCNNWRAGPFHVAHLSDGLRLLTLLKYGGYYFDLDVLMVRPVTYYRNFFGRPDDYNVANCAIHADLNNPVIALALKDFITNYRSDLWAHNGPAGLLRVLQKWCNTSDVTMMNYVHCKGFHVLPRLSFNSIHFSKLDELFVQQLPKDIGTPKWLSDQVIGVHTCNKMSSDELLYKNSTQGYIRLAREHCPHIYSIAPEIF